MARGLADIGAEGVLLAGAGRAILLQIADPRVGHGVADHSNFVDRPQDRLKATLTYVYAIVYGSEEQVTAVRRAVNRAHAPVRRTADGTSSGYSAFDASSQLWVVATLYNTALTVYEQVHGTLDDETADLMYRDYARIGTALQLPADMWPVDRAAFAQYWNEQLAVLRPDEKARKIARDLLYPVGGPALMRLVMPVARFLTVGLLPDHLRQGFGFDWTPVHARRFDRTMRVVGRVYPRLPQRIRHWPRDYCLSTLKPTPLRDAVPHA
ncbi:oxygenase MpaB family protein [Paenarthrobacter sp. NPDC089675]|uniref:oxygenase MpaB family protein n=1 Tax=Paenarthrobacter sp. NPDC089675 TaxID=3364376 RepID=UPI0038018DD7